MLKVLGALLNAPDAECYGFDLYKRAGMKPGTIYPIFARLLAVGWFEGRWEDINPAQQGRLRLSKISKSWHVKDVGVPSTMPILGIGCVAAFIGVAALPVSTKRGRRAPGCKQRARRARLAESLADTVAASIRRHAVTPELVHVGRAPSTPWMPFRTLRGDELRVRTTTPNGWVEALIPSGIQLNDPDRVDCPMLWRKAEWPSLLELQSDTPPAKVSTLRLADVVLQHRAEAAWMLDQAVQQLDGLRHYLMIIADRPTSMQATAETARRALYLRAQLGAATNALAADGSIRSEQSADISELSADIERRSGRGPEDWVPLRALDALANVRDDRVRLRIRYPNRRCFRWTGDITALRSLMLKLAEAARVADCADLPLLVQRLEYTRQAIRDAEQNGHGRGLALLGHTIESHLILVRTLVSEPPNASRSRQARRVARELRDMNRRVRYAAEIAGARSTVSADSSIGRLLVGLGFATLIAPLIGKNAAMLGVRRLLGDGETTGDQVTFEDLEGDLLPVPVSLGR